MFYQKVLHTVAACNLYVQCVLHVHCVFHVHWVLHVCVCDHVCIALLYCAQVVAEMEQDLTVQSAPGKKVGPAQATDMCT